MYITLAVGMFNENCFFLQIQEIEINVDEQNEEGGEKKSAKEALLLWCQRNVRGYRNVEIKVYYSSQLYSQISFS